METLRNTILGGALLNVRLLRWSRTPPNCRVESLIVSQQRVLHVCDFPVTGRGLDLYPHRTVRTVDSVGNILGRHVHPAVGVSISSSNRPYLPPQAGWCPQYWNDAHPDSWRCSYGHEHCTQVSAAKFQCLFVNSHTRLRPGTNWTSKRCVDLHCFDY